MKNTQTPLDCKCGAKYVTGLRSAVNGQMVDDNNQFECFSCYNKRNSGRLKAEDDNLYGSLENGKRFSFDGTEEDFIRQAIKAGLKVYENFSGKTYLHDGADSTLLTVYRNEWLDKLSCACVVSHAPLRELLARHSNA